MPFLDFAFPVDNRVKIKENEKRDMYLVGPGQRTKKFVEHESKGNI